VNDISQIPACPTDNLWCSCGSHADRAYIIEDQGLVGFCEDCYQLWKRSREATDEEFKAMQKEINSGQSTQ
jgi:hypothetical protein